MNTYICEQVYKNDVQTYKKCMKETPYQNLQKTKLERGKQMYRRQERGVK